MRLAETAVWPISFLINMLSALKRLGFIFIWILLHQPNSFIDESVCISFHISAQKSVQ